MQVTRPHDWPEDCGGSSFEGEGTLWFCAVPSPREG